ncbi:hypothetical protein KIW84_034975 [Lathyrus oleraceus]|uniref:Uncharacterized protein n=1 Tax=Pisum sativum TaxID=3888 RepID=A0A9D4Y1P5_PEA|nr:hypothetical protein KIW84_034975 [Pisum sativum]
MIANAPSDFAKMVNMGMRLEEGVREGRLSKEEVSSNKRYGSSFSKNKDNEAIAISSGRQRRPPIIRSQPSRQHHHQVSSVIAVFSASQSLPVQQQQCQQQQPQQQTNTYNNNNTNNHQQQTFERKKVSFDPIPMTYAELYPSLEHPGHDIENCYPLRYEVQKLVKSRMVSFEDRAPDVKANPLPAHGNSSVNMVDGCLGEFKVFDVRFIRRSLVTMHKDICLVNESEYDHDGCAICSVNSRERVVIQYDSSNSNNISQRSISLLVIRLEGPVLYASDKAVPYQYNATMVKDVFGPVFPKDVEDSIVSKKGQVPAVDPVSASKCQSGESINLKTNDDDEVLRLIKKSEFNVVEQLLQTPSKISVLSLLMNSEAHREALQKVLEKVFMEHDVTMDQFDHIVANITSCNNLSFRDEELPEEGRNHNLALHISINCKDDAISNVLVDTESSLNMLPKSTLSKLSYQGTPMRPWIHEAGAVTSTLHQKLKFVKNGKLAIIGGEKALLVSHLSSFSYVEAEDVVGTPFQALSIVVEKRIGASMSSLKDARKIVEEGIVDQWGRVVEVSDNKDRTDLGFQQGSSTARSEDMQLNFGSRWFIHGNEQHLAAVLENDKEEDCTNFVEEESDEEVSDEWSRLLEHEGKAIHPFVEKIDLVNLGFEDDVKEVKIGSRLCLDVKKGLIDLLREYSYVFA